MFIEQYTEETGNVGTRGTGEVKYGKLHNNAANRVWIGNIPAGTYTRKEFVQAVRKACTNPQTGNTLCIGAASNKVCSLFTSSGDWAREEFGITRSNNASKTEVITIGVKAAKATTAPRKGKAKAVKAQQQKLPL
jgi:hypothetical protein